MKFWARLTRLGVFLSASLRLWLRFKALRVSDHVLSLLLIVMQVRAALAPYWDGLHPEVPIVIEVSAAADGPPLLQSKQMMRPSAGLVQLPAVAKFLWKWSFSQPFKGMYQIVGNNVLVRILGRSCGRQNRLSAVGESRGPIKSLPFGALNWSRRVLRDIRQSEAGSSSSWAS